MATRQSVQATSTSRVAASKSISEAKADRSHELYEFLPRTGLRSEQRPPKVEQVFGHQFNPANLEFLDKPVQRRKTVTIPKRTKAEIARRQTVLSRTLVALALILLIGSGAYAGYLYQKSSAIRTYAAPILANDTVAQAFPGMSSMNLVIIGRDYDYNNQDQVIKTHARSDMLMVAHIDFAGKAAHLLSIPRDVAVAIPGHKVNKINAAHAFGGPLLSEATIADNFGIKSDHYIALDFNGFVQAIDLLGGVDLNVDKKMDYDDNWGHLHIHLLPGMQHLNGEQAMEFVRFRHSDSDIIRTHRQQALMAALKAKLMLPQTLAIMPQLLDTIDKHVDSDLTPIQKVALAKFIHDLPNNSIQMLTMPTAMKGQTEVADYTNDQPIIGTWFNATIPANATQLVAAHLHRSLRTGRLHHHVVIVASAADQGIRPGVAPKYD